MQSLQDKKRNFHKDACACDEEMRKVREDPMKVGWRQMIVKMKSGACKQGKKEEAAALRSPMDAASTLVWSSFSPWRPRMRDSRSKPCRKNSSEGSKFQPLLCTGQEEEQAQRAASRRVGPQEPGGRNEGAPAGSAFDPAWYQDANGESGGGGDFNTPGNGPKTREGSRTPRRQVPLVAVARQKVTLSTRHDLFLG